MESFFEEKKKEKKGLNYGLLIGMVVGVILIGAALWVISLRPPVEDQRAQVLETAHREGTPEFADLTKDIIISTDEKTIEWRTGLGTISMSIVGNIRNKGTKTITALEVNVSVVDQQNQVVKEKRVLAVPEQHTSLPPNETVEVTLALEGFEPRSDRANIRWKVTALKAAGEN